MSLRENFCTCSPSGLCTGKKNLAKRRSHSTIESRTSSSGVLNVPFSLLGGGKIFFLHWVKIPSRDDQLNSAWPQAAMPWVYSLPTMISSCNLNFSKKKNVWGLVFFLSLREIFCTSSPSGLCTGWKKQAKRVSHSIISSRTSSSGVLNVPFSLLGGGKIFFFKGFKIPSRGAWLK